MAIKNHLSLGEAKNIIERLENELELYLSKKKINFYKTQPKSSRLTEIKTSESHKIIFDAFNHYVIKDEECDEKIYELQELILSYQSYIIKEMKSMSKYDEVGLINYYREIGLTWEQIDKRLHRGTDYSRTKYKRYIENKNDPH